MGRVGAGLGGLLAAAVAVPVLALAAAPAGASGSASVVSIGTEELGPAPASTPIVAAPATALVSGDQLVVSFDGDVSATTGWSIVLTDGTSEATLDSSDATLSDPSATSIDVTLGLGGAVGMPSADLEVLASSGIGPSGGGGWNLVRSGEVSRVDPSSSAPADTPPTCSTVDGSTRVFGGSNCDIGFGPAGGPLAPDIFDIIAVPTTDLVGPPLDSAPEVITNCLGGSSDSVYDLASAAPLSNPTPCGTWPAGESELGNTTSSSLAYIPVPTLASFEQVGVVETTPGSDYVSATAVPPQLTGIAVSGAVATFDYDTPVTCQDQSGGFDTYSQFSYTSPWWDTGSEADRVYPVSIACPDAAGATSIAVTYQSAIPSSVTFKFEGYGDGSFIVGGSASPFAGEREASQSAYVGSAALPPAPSVDSLAVDPSSPALTSSGGQVGLDFTTANATRCSLTGPAGTTVSLRYRDSAPGASPLTYAFTTPGASAEVPCPDQGSDGIAEVSVPANSSTSSAASYSFTLSAAGLSGDEPSPATDTVSLSVPASAPAPSTPPAGSTSSGTSTPPPPVTTTTPTPVAVPLPAVVLPPRPVVLALAPARAQPKGHVWVRIHGDGFAKHDTVRFGSKRALRVRELSSHVLLVLCPPGHGVVQVSVHTAAGTSLRVRSSRFTY